MVRQVKLRNRNYWAWFAKEPGEMPSKSLYVAAFALWPQGDEPLELGDYFWYAFPRFYFGLCEAERAPFARYAGAMLERFLRRAQNKEDLRQVALALHRLHFSKNNT